MFRGVSDGSAFQSGSFLRIAATASEIVSPVSGVFAMARAVGSAFERLAEVGTLRDDLDRLIAFDDFTDLVGLPAAQAVDARYNL